MRILVAEDDPDIRQLLELVLGSHELSVAGNGQQAIAMIDAASQPFDVALLDVMMPRVDGLAVLRHIRASDAMADIPVICLTAKAGDEARLEGFRAGADAYLTKPFSPDRVQAAIDHLVGLEPEDRRQAREIAAQQG